MCYLLILLLVPRLVLAAHLQRKLPSTRIVFWAKPRMEQPTLPTIARSGMTVEADVLQERRRLYEWVLDPLFSLSGRV